MRSWQRGQTRSRHDGMLMACMCMSMAGNVRSRVCVSACRVEECLRSQDDCDV